MNLQLAHHRSKAGKLDDDVDQPETGSQHESTIKSRKECVHSQVGRPIGRGHVDLAHLDVESARSADSVPHMLRLRVAVLAADDHATNRVTKLLGIGPFQSLALRVVHLGLRGAWIMVSQQTRARAHLQARELLHRRDRDEHITHIKLVQLLRRRQ